MQNCSVRPWDVRATRTKREIWKSGDAGHLERLPGQHPSPRGGVCVVSAVGPSKDPARASTCSHPCLRFLVSCALLSVCPAPTPGLSGPIKHQRHVFSPSLRPLDPGSLSFLPVLHCSSFLSPISSLNSLLVMVFFCTSPSVQGLHVPCTVASSCFLG